jgi:hypothetical protein
MIMSSFPVDQAANPVVPLSSPIILTDARCLASGGSDFLAGGCSFVDKRLSHCIMYDERRTTQNHRSLSVA